MQGSELKRSHSAGGVSNEAMVAEYINPAETSVIATAAFSLPDFDDAFTIKDNFGGDSGAVILDGGAVSVALGGTATYDSDTGEWTTPAAGDSILITALNDNTAGSWTMTTGTATADISADDDGNAAVTDRKLILTVAATVSSSQEATETRVYEIIPRPD
jgi:hypothetical protein